MAFLFRFAAIFLLVAGSAARADDADEMNRRHSYFGKTLAELIVGIGRPPASATELSPGRRLFVFYGDTVVLSQEGDGFVPGVAAERTCRVTVDTRRVAHTGTASDFQIVDIGEPATCGTFF